MNEIWVHLDAYPCTGLMRTFKQYEILPFDAGGHVRPIRQSDAAAGANKG